MTFTYFKGSTSYELQIGNVVFQVPFRLVRWNTNTAYDSWLCRNFGIHIWLDPHGRWFPRHTKTW